VSVSTVGTIPSPQPLYLASRPDPTFVTYHRPADTGARNTAVLLCPPFGFDEVCAYRSLRHWALTLAAQGYPTLRLSLPATGDSGGAPRDPERLGAWTSATAIAADWLRRASGADRVVAIGIGLGGALACSAVAEGAPIDDLVLWGVPSRARSLVRQLRAFSQLEMSLFYEGLPAPPPMAEGELEAGGFVLSAETMQALGSLDLTALALPDPETRRVLLLERDGMAIDDGLRTSFERQGMTVGIAPGDGYASMTSHPQEAVAPLEVIERVSGWLAEAAGVASGDRAASEDLVDGASPRAELSLGQASVTETPIRIPQPFGDLAGVLVAPAHRPAHGVCVLLLNAGAVRRIGPGRMWVTAARAWAQRGVPTLRLDVEGIGDADGDGTPYRDDGALYVPGLVPQIISAIDHLQEQGVGERFIVGGLCAGAYWSFHAALTDPRVIAALMINPRALVWDTGLEPARDLRVLLRERPSLSKIRRVATPDRARALVLWLLGAPLRWLRLVTSRRRAPLIDHQVDQLLDRLLASDKRALFLFADHEPLHRELVSSGRIVALEASPHVTVEYVPVHDHTLRPGWAQREALQILDRSIDRELADVQALTA
jgi:hypothetical protein